MVTPNAEAWSILDIDKMTFPSISCLYFHGATNDMMSLRIRDSWDDVGSRIVLQVTCKKLIVNSDGTAIASFDYGVSSDAIDKVVCAANLYTQNVTQRYSEGIIFTTECVDVKMVFRGDDKLTIYDETKMYSNLLLYVEPYIEKLSDTRVVFYCSSS